MEKILIGTPIIDFKDYSIPQWLKSVDALRCPNKELYMVDNSDSDYTAQLEQHCKELKIPYEIARIDAMGMETEERLAEARETIREKFLEGDYTMLLSWECDILVPEDAYETMTKYRGDVIRGIPKSRFDAKDNRYSLDFGLYTRELLEKFEFEGQFGKNVDPRMMGCYHGGDIWFVKRIEEAGYSIVDLKNIFKIEHLN